MDAQTVIIGLLSLVCGLLAYWGTRLEGRVDRAEENQCRIVEERHKNYVPREDCRERTGQILAGLERLTTSLDRVADSVRSGKSWKASMITRCCRHWPALKRRLMRWRPRLKMGRTCRHEQRSFRRAFRGRRRRGPCLCSTYSWGARVMAHPKSKRMALRSAYCYKALSLEEAAALVGISIGTARRWKTDAQKAEDDDWDKVKAASSSGGRGHGSRGPPDAQ